MPTNYKYIDHETAGKRRNWRSLVLLILLVLGIFITATYSLFFLQTRGMDEMILTGQYSQAIGKLNHWTWLPLVSGRVCEKLGAATILQNGASTANPLLQAAESRMFFRPISIWQEVLKILWSYGRYHDGLAYATHIEKALPDQAVIHYYKAGFLTGENQLVEATSELKLAEAVPELAKEISILKSEIEQRTSTGQYGFLFDRENLPIVNLTMKGEPVFLKESVTSLLKNSRYDLMPKFNNRQNQGILTIDFRIQNAAVKAMDKYAGAVIVLDVHKGDILAAASSLKGFGSDYPVGTQLALLQEYEPGSIIKMITLAGGLEKGVDIGKIFPLQCDGSLKLSENHILYDWKTHGQVTDIAAATAVSCNVAFAKIGLAMNPDDLLSNLKQFGFNSRIQNNVLDVELGKILDGEVDDLYLANLSIGLDHLQMTPLHAALLAASIANDGVAPAPRLLLSYRNIIGLPFGNSSPGEFRRFMSESSAHTIGQAMQDVVTNPDGTGRRAAVQGFPFAMKTGTAGDAVKGYNAIVIGFGPVPEPKIAFAIVLEHAGKAEFEGARVTRLFLESIQSYIK